MSLLLLFPEGGTGGPASGSGTAQHLLLLMQWEPGAVQTFSASVNKSLASSTAIAAAGFTAPVVDVTGGVGYYPRPAKAPTRKTPGTKPKELKPQVVFTCSANLRVGRMRVRARCEFDFETFLEDEDEQFAAVLALL